MTALINMPRAAWKRQPVGAVKINRSHEAANFLVYAAIGGPSFNRVTEEKEIVIGSVITTTNSSGYAAYNQSDVSNRLGFPEISFGDNFLILCVAQSRTLNTNQQIIANDNLSAIRTFQFRTSNASKLQFIRFNVDLSSVITLESSQSISINTPFHALAWSSGVNNGLILNNGSEVIGQLTGTPTSWGSGNNTNWFCRRNGISSYVEVSSADLMLRCVFKSALSSGLRKSLSNNPWQLFAPAPSRFYLIPSGGGSTTHDVALILAYTAAFQPTATAQFNAGITLETLAGALSGKNAQFNTALTLDTNVSVTLQRALSALASVQLDMTAAQSVSALNAAVAAITESISCSYTSSVTAHLLASMSFGITQALISGTGSQLAAALALALNAGTQASATATYAADLTLLTALQAALQATLATTANLTLPATLTLTIDGERLTDGDVALALNVQTGISTSATALLSAQLTLATQLLATPAGVASFQAALTLAQQIGTLFSTGNTLTSSLSFAVSMALAESAALSLGGSLELGTVLSQVQSALASFQAGVTFPTALTLPITGGLAMEDGISLGWTLGMNIDGAFFEITVTLPTGRVIVLSASERLLSISASERLITIPPP